MNTRLNVFAMTSVALLLGLASTGSAIAQESRQAMPGPEMDRASCEDVSWNRSLLRDYPWVADGCQEAIIVDGQKWARFEAEFEQLHHDGAITSDFRDENGRSLGSVRLMPGEDQRVMLDGRPYRFSELKEGQVLNFYAPENAYAFTTKPGASDTEMVKIVEPRKEREMAKAQPAKTKKPETLPATAGPLPIIALGGILSLLGGVTLTTRRRLKAPKS